MVELKKTMYICSQNSTICDYLPRCIYICYLRLPVYMYLMCLLLLNKPVQTSTEVLLVPQLQRQLFVAAVAVYRKEKIEPFSLLLHLKE